MIKSRNYYWCIGSIESSTVRLRNGTKFEFNPDVPDDDPRIHIGKLSELDGAALFDWAQDDTRVRQICAEHGEEAVIRDDDNALWTGLKFLEVLERVGTNQNRKIGHRFR